MKNLIQNRLSVNLFVKSGAFVLLLLIGQSAFGQDPDAKGQVRSLNRLTTVPVDNDTKGTVNSLFGNLSALGSQWQVTECCGWSGTWTRRPNTNVFDAVWRHTNGSSASGVVELKSWNQSTNEVIIYRQSMNGSYKAQYNPTSRTLTNGTTTWYPAGQIWSAIIR